MLRTRQLADALRSHPFTSLLCATQGSAIALAIGLNLSCASAQQPSQAGAPAPTPAAPHGTQALLELRALQAATAAPAAPAMPAVPAVPAAPAAPAATTAPFAFEFSLPAAGDWLHEDDEHEEDEGHELELERAELEGEIAELQAALAALEQQLEQQRAHSGGGKHKLKSTKSKQPHAAAGQALHPKARAELDAARAQSIAQIQARAEALAQAHADQAQALARTHGARVKKLAEVHAQQAQAYAQSHAAQGKRYAQLDQERALAIAAQAQQQAWDALKKAGHSFRFDASACDPQGAGSARIYVTPEGKRVRVVSPGQQGGAWSYGLVPRNGTSLFGSRASDDCGDCEDCSEGCCDSCSDCGDAGCSAPTAPRSAQTAPRSAPTAPRTAHPFFAPTPAPAAPACAPCPTEPHAPATPSVPEAPAAPSEEPSIVRQLDAARALEHEYRDIFESPELSAALRPVRYSELVERLQPGAWNPVQARAADAWSDLWPTQSAPQAHELSEIEELVSSMCADVRSLREELRGLRTALELPAANELEPAPAELPQAAGAR